MPRAGWCRECDDWVWVDQEDACQYGHGSECMERIHEQADPSSDPRPLISSYGGPAPFGVGDMPESIRRFSWGAFVLTPIWGVVYGVWPVLSVWLLMLLAPLVLGSLVPSGSSFALMAAATVMSQVVTSALRLWVGMSAYAWAWRREQFRLGRIPDAEPRHTIDSFMAGQRRWLIGCGIYVALNLAGMVMMASSNDAAVLKAMDQFGLTSALVWLSLGWTVAELLLAAWLDSQMRKGGRTEPAGEH